MKKILLLTASYGTGHVSACKFVRKELDALYAGSVQTNIYDFIKIETFVPSSGIFEKLYNFSMEKPRIWDVVFFLSDNALVKYYFTVGFPLFYKELYKIFDFEEPVSCVTTHPYWNYVIDGYNRIRAKEGKPPLKYFTVITDAIEIHKTWLTEGSELFFVADDDTAAVVEKLGIPKEKINVSGFPVNTEFGEPFDSRPFLSGMGLDPSLPTILFVTGLGDTEKFLRLIDHFGNMPSLKFQIIVVTGKYKQIFDLLSAKKYSVPCKIIGWTDRMADFVRSADLLVCKSGGASVMEAIAAGTPMLIPVFSPGQERGNAELIRKNGIGFIAPKFEEAAVILERLIKEPREFGELKSRVKKLSKPLAARTIARIVYENSR
jgi:processive 1,2-diacylglycerol beta-glucosyltransferase